GDRSGQPARPVRARGQWRRGQTDAVRHAVQRATKGGAVTPDCPFCGTTLVHTPAGERPACPACGGTFAPGAPPPADEQVALARVANTPAFRTRYEVGRVLGRGGFAIVFEARRVRDGRSVAIKFL